MHGKCLCGKIGFVILDEVSKLYQCHCSLCRRQGGSSSNTATILAAKNFQWLRGTEIIRTWVKDSGFRSNFCSHCGSPVPNQIRDLPYFWVPAGLLEATTPMEICAHLFVASKAPWDIVSSPGVQYETMPKLSVLLELLHPKTEA